MTEEFRFLKPTKMLHPGNGMELEYLDKQSAIAALIVSADEKSGYFVKQFRPGLNKEVLEVVAGLIDEGEIPMEAMYREVMEEAGFDKSDYDLIYEVSEPLAISPGYTTEKLSLYILKLHEGAVQHELSLDEGEELVGDFYPMEEVLKVSCDFKTHFLIRMFELYSLKKK